VKWVVGSVAVLVALVAGVVIGWVARARQDQHLFDQMQRAAGDVVAIDPTHDWVREAWAKAHVEDAADLVSGARFLPVVADGGVAAVRAYGVRRGGALAQLGIQNGDTIETLNAISLATPETALDAYTRGSKSKKLVLGIERRGEHMDLHYLVTP